MHKYWSISLFSPLLFCTSLELVHSNNMGSKVEVNHDCQSFIDLDLLFREELSLPFLDSLPPAIVKWDLVSIYAKFSSELMRYHGRRLIWHLVLKNRVLNEQELMEFKYLFDQLDWDVLSRYQPLSESFIRLHTPRLNIEEILQNPKITLTDNYRRELQDQTIRENNSGLLPVDIVPF